LGSISPKRRIINVTITTWMRNSRPGEFSMLIIAFRVKEESMTMAILMKLLVIRMVARSRSGFSSIRMISRDLLVFFASRSERFEGESEKKATSDPDAKAEPTSNKTMQRIVRSMVGVNG
jgi:hypothetical protein